MKLPKTTIFAVFAASLQVSASTDSPGLDLECSESLKVFADTFTLSTEIEKLVDEEISVI